MNALGTAPPPAAVPSRLLSEQLAQLQTTFADRPATLREVLVALEGRAYLLLMILLALPFAPPVSVPGSSTPLGLIISIIAVQLAVGRLPWLPRRVLDWQLPAGFFTKLVRGTQKIVRRLERILHPRLPALTDAAAVRALHLIMICVAGLLLAVPAPIPLTNTFPGWTILLLACGLLERDGFFILAGYGMLAATGVLFALVGTAIVEAMHHSWQWLAG